LSGQDEGAASLTCGVCAGAASAKSKTTAAASPIEYLERTCGLNTRRMAASSP
jgi:hypothetical protein